MAETTKHRRRRAIGVVAAFTLLSWWLPQLASSASPQGVITGRVTGPDGLPLTSASGVCALPGATNSPAGVVSDDGTYRIQNLPSGTYGVRFLQCDQRFTDMRYAPEFYPNRHDPLDADSLALPNVKVVDGQTTSGIDAQLEVGGSLSFTVRDTAGRAREGLCAMAELRPGSAGRHSVGQLPEGFWDTSDSAGEVRFEGMPPGNYSFLLRACDELAVTEADADLTRFQYSGGGQDRATASVHPVRLGDTTVVPDVVMAPAATVRGRVTANGRPVPNNCVVWHGEGQREIRTTTDSDGNYELRGITHTIPGSIEACRSLVGDSETWAFDGPYAALWYPAAASRATAPRLSLSAGSAMTWDVALPRTETRSYVVTSLPSAAGCHVRLPRTPEDLVLPLRATELPGVWVADTLGIAKPIADAFLDCDGRTIGMAESATNSTPRYGQTWGADEPSPVYEIKADRNGPTITAAGVPANWTNKPVTISFSCTDTITWVTSCPATQAFSEGTRRTVSATDRFGNTTTMTLGPLKVDQTRPVLSLATTQRTFRRDETLYLGCRISDARSGLKVQSNTCPPNGTRASTLDIGEHRFVMLAADNAGNTAGTYIDITIVK